MAERKRFLITGAAGRIGSTLVAGLCERYDVRGLDRRPLDGLEDFVVGELADLETMQRAARGVDGIAHLAAWLGKPDSWEEALSSNIVGVRNVLEAARLEGVRRVVLASTSQVINGYPMTEPMRWDMRPRPVNTYATTKVFAEALGHLYAAQHGLEVVCIRIGNFPPSGRYPPGTQPTGKYLSHRDAVQLFECALTQPGLRYEIVFGTSNSRHMRFDLEHTRQVLGYNPQDWEEDAIEASP